MNAVVSQEPVILDISGGIGHLTLNRPAAANAVDLPTAKALVRAVRACAEDGSVRVVVVTGAGRRFCAGGDVRAFAGAAEPEAYLKDLAATLGDAVRLLSEIPKPVVAGVHGAVAAAGLGFVLAADLVVAARGTKFSVAFANIGLTPDSGVSFLLPHVVGLRRALHFAISGDVLTAEEALACGLVSEEVEPEELTDRVMTVARDIAEGPAAALGQTRRLLRSSIDGGRDVHARDEVTTISSAVTTPDATARIAQFLGRKP